MTIPPGPLGGAPLSIPAGILSAFTVISTLAELDAIAPAGPGGVRALNVPGCVLVAAAIDLPVGERIVVGSDTVLRGCDADISGLRGEVDAPLVSGTDGLVVTDLFLRNFSAGTSSVCIEATNGGLPGARIVRIQDVSVGGTRGVRIYDVAGCSIDNLLSRAEVRGLVIDGRSAGVQVVDGVFIGAAPASPVHVEIAGTNHGALRIDGCVFVCDPGAIGLELVGAPLLALLRVGGNDFIPNGGQTILPANFPDLQPDIYFLGNSFVPDSTFGGAMTYNGNPTAQATAIPGVGTILPGGEVTNAARIGAGNPASPLFALAAGSARVALDQPAGAESARLIWAAAEATNVAIEASISIRSADGSPKAIAGQLVRLPGGGGPPVFLAAFTSVTGGLLFSAGFVGVSAAIAAMPPGDAIAVEIANLTDGVNLICDSVSVSMRAC